MAIDTPDDAKAAEPGTAPEAAGAQTASNAAEADRLDPPGVEMVEPTVNRASEWLASDTRGPLETADEHRGADPIDFHSRAGSGPGDVSERPTGPAEAAAPAASGPAQTISQPDRPRRRSAWPVAAALVLGALIGAGSGTAVYTYLGGRMTGSEDGSDQIARLSNRLDTLEHRPDEQAAIAGLTSDVAGLNGKLAALRTPASEGPAADASALDQKIAALQSKLDALAAQSAAAKTLDSKIATLEGDLAGAQKERSATQAHVADVQAQQKVLADRVGAPALAVVADSLVQQIARGAPYAEQVDALGALGADPTDVAVLRQNAEKGVPSARMLAAKFEPLAEPISASAHKAPPNAGFVDRLKSGMFSLVSIRSADDTSGTDLPSRVARIKAALAHDDIAEAEATWQALPAEIKEKTAGWGALVASSGEAMRAARALQQRAIASLGAHKT